MSLRHDMSVHLYQAGHMPRAKDVISFVRFSILHAHRPHSAGGCYQTGFMKSGNLNFIESKACPKGPPKGGVWFQVSVKAHDQDAQIYFNGDLVTTIKTHHTLQARAGVFTFHGYQNVVLFLETSKSTLSSTSLKDAREQSNFRGMSNSMQITEAGRRMAFVKYRTWMAVERGTTR